MTFALRIGSIWGVKRDRKPSLTRDGEENRYPLFPITRYYGR